MRPERDPLEKFEEEWRAWLDRPERPFSPERSLGTKPARKLYGSLLVAVALVFCTLLALLVWTPPPKRPSEANRLSSPSHTSSPWSEVAIPLGKTQAVFWLDASTPLYISLEPGSPHPQKGIRQ